MGVSGAPKAGAYCVCVHLCCSAFFPTTGCGFSFGLKLRCL